MEKQVNYYYQQYQIPELKKAFPQFRDIQSQVSQYVMRRVDRAYQNFFRRIEEKRSGKQQTAGFPRFKPRQRPRLITYLQSGFDVLENGHLKLSKIGTVRMFMHREINSAIRTLNISHSTTGELYASFSVEQENVAHKLPETRKNVGVDGEIRNLVVISNETFVWNPGFLKRYLLCDWFWHRGPEIFVLPHQNSKGVHIWSVLRNNYLISH